jgi:hypothetical protein
MTVIGNSYSSTHYTSYDAVGNVLASYQQTGGGQNFTSNQSVRQDDDDHF